MANNFNSTIPADIYLTNEAQEILKNKFVIMIGDSVIRSMYKDLIKLLQTNDHLTDYQLKNKGEHSFENDVLLEGGQKGQMSNDVSYTEVREYKTDFNLIRFYFVTRCYSDYLISICQDIKNDREKPDVVIMNSGCWDLTRYGPNSIYEYKNNLPLAIFSLIKVLPARTVFIWTTTLPLSKDVKGGFMIPDVEGRKSKLREDVLEANQYASNVINEFKLDLIDLHYYFLKHIQRRAKDGIHWDATAHRRISNLILNHLCEAWDIETPGRILVKKNPSLIEPVQDIDINRDFYDDEESDQNSLPADLINKIEEIKQNKTATEPQNNNNCNNNNNNNNNKRIKLNHVSNNLNDGLFPFPLMNINFNYSPIYNHQQQIHQHLTNFLTPIIQQQIQAGVIKPSLIDTNNNNNNNNNNTNKNLNTNNKKRRYPD